MKLCIINEEKIYGRFIMKKLLRKISMVACSLVLSITMVAATSSSSFALNRCRSCRDLRKHQRA